MYYNITRLRLGSTYTDDTPFRFYMDNAQFFHTAYVATHTSFTTFLLFSIKNVVKSYKNRINCIIILLLDLANKIHFVIT